MEGEKGNSEIRREASPTFSLGKPDRRPTGKWKRRTFLNQRTLAEPHPAASTPAPPARVERSPRNEPGLTDKGTKCVPIKTEGIQNLVRKCAKFTNM